MSAGAPPGMRDRATPAVQDNEPPDVQDCGKALHQAGTAGAVRRPARRRVRTNDQQKVRHRARQGEPAGDAAPLSGYAAGALRADPAGGNDIEVGAGVHHRQLEALQASAEDGL